MIKKVLLFSISIIMVLCIGFKGVYAQEVLLLPIKTNLGLSTEDNLLNQEGITRVIISHLSLSGIDVFSYKQSKDIERLLIQKKVRYSNLNRYARYVISGEAIRYLEYYELNLKVYDFNRNRVIFDKHHKIFIPNVKEEGYFFYLKKDKLLFLLRSINPRRLTKREYYLLASYINRLSKFMLSARLNSDIIKYLNSLLRSNIGKVSKDRITTYVSSNNKLLMSSHDVLHLVNPLIDSLITFIKVKAINSKNWQRQVDIMFVIDSTKSLYDEVTYLKKNLRDILSTIYDTRSDIELRIGITTGLYDKRKIKMLPLTSNIEVIEKYLDNILKHSLFVKNSDIRYGLFYTLNNANWLPYKEQLKMVFLLTDKTIKPSLGESVQSVVSNYSFAESVKLANYKNIKVYTIGCSGIDKVSRDSLTRVSRLMYGEYYNLEYYFSAFLLNLKRVNFVYKAQEVFKFTGDIPSTGYFELINKGRSNSFESISLGDMVSKEEDTKSYLLNSKYPIDRYSFVRKRISNNLLNIVTKKVIDSVISPSFYYYFTFISDNYYLPIKVASLTKKELTSLKSWSKDKQDIYIAVSIVPIVSKQVRYLENNRFITKAISFDINPHIVKIFAPIKSDMVPSFLVKRVSSINELSYKYAKEGISKKKYWFLKGKLLFL